MAKDKPVKECTHATCGEICRREKKPKERGKPIARFSKKREKINREYDKKAKAFREANRLCAIKQEGCTIFTDGVHHTKGRIGALLMDERFWLPACNHCNSIWIEGNSKEAMEKGFKKSKFTT